MGRPAGAREAAWAGAILALAAGILGLERISGRRAVPERPAPAAPSTLPAPPARIPAERLLADWRRGREIGVPSADLERLEREIEAALAELSPGAVVDLLVRHGTADALPLFLRALEGALARDRAAAEEALTAALENLSEDSARLEGLAEVALERLRDPGRRDRAAHALARAAVAPRLLVRILPGLSPRTALEVRERLWERAAGEEEAAEALGHLVEPEEISRLESLGPRPGVLRALEIAAERTGRAAFRAAAERLRRQ
ncbi:MAG TPA: hypothetical protein VNO22_09925 [Planctomycetota bacterium]|nr:hypothetical protein [Planctomycetota bacterium]